MTTLQVQYLLAYLGYDPGPLDGILGGKTREAVRSFQRDFPGLQVDGVSGGKTQEALRQAVARGMPEPATSGTPPDRQLGGTYWDSIRYFQRREFRCPCPRCGGFPVEPEEGLVRLADRVRTHFGVPVLISSGVRCAEHNREVGGVAASRHLRGKAMDFCVPGVAGATVLSFVQSMGGVRYAYAIDRSFVHMDVE